MLVGVVSDTHNNIKNIENIIDIFNLEKVDVVVVLTPSGMHAKNVIDLSKYGKHIMVEKPMALTLSDADAMIEA